MLYLSYLSSYQSSREISQHNVFFMLELLLTGTSSSSSNADSGIEEITSDTISRLIDGTHDCICYVMMFSIVVWYLCIA